MLCYAIYIFCSNISEEQPSDVFNFGYENESKNRVQMNKMANRGEIVKGENKM